MLILLNSYKIFYKKYRKKNSKCPFHLSVILVSRFLFTCSKMKLGVDIQGS